MVDIYRKLSVKVNLYKGIPKSVTELYFLVRKYLPKSPIILEAGAHMGFDTLGLANIWPNSMIHAFEPIPNLYKDLRERVKDKRNVKTYNIALGEKSSPVEMYVSSGGSSASSSVLKPTKHIEMFPNVAFESKIVVSMKTLNEWAEEQNVSKIDLMWLDMQGYEVNALKGADSLIRGVSVIYTELCQTELYEGLSIRGNYEPFLKDLGFNLIKIHGDEEVSEGVFVNKNFKFY